MNKILVCGGRNYNDKDHVYKVLSELFKRYEFDMLIHGECPYGGADIIAGEWAREFGIQEIKVPANFKFYGKIGGPRRNRHMAQLLSNNDIIIAFPGGRGTESMLKEAFKLIDENWLDIGIFQSDGVTFKELEEYVGN